MKIAPPPRNEELVAPLTSNTFFLSKKNKSSIRRQWLPAKDLPQLQKN